ncbi:MAG TPA: transglutaminase-like domain-containing protein [Planctomycetota bacterium]|nr:transglutaminase-like domain-containing protein [Planctomycetota bacterium]
MSAPPVPSRAAAHVAAITVLACTTLAMANLPADALPIEWLLAFTLPGAVMGLLRPHGVHSWWRALLALALQTGACYLALELVGPMSRPAALACTILPPLAFVTARHQDSDAALALFLSFCVLLVGVILDGVHLPLLLAYGAAGCASLRCAAHIAAHTLGRPSRRRPAMRAERLATVTSSLVLVLACLCAGFAIERTLGWLPSPSRQRTADAESPTEMRGPRSVGLSDSFVLDGGQGVLSELTGEQLVRVRSEAGDEVPGDLYLRSGFFAVPGLDRWQLGALERAPAPRADGHVLRRPLPRVATSWLELERFAGARNFVFVPPHTCEVRGLEDLIVDRTREWLRQREGSAQNVYQVGYQRLPHPAAEARLDPRASRLGLLGLPVGLDRRPFEDLLHEWRVGDDPARATDQIAAGLAARCRYDRIEPVGPYAHALENFLFASGDRRGYCMHFASAAALMLRLRGIPCRIGVGLYGGDPDRKEPGARIYGSQHAHAWVEIPYVDRGYVVFDPTPAAERGRRTPSRLDTTPTAEAGQPVPAGQAGEAAAEFLRWVTQPWLLVLALLLAVASAAWPTGTPQPPRIATPATAKTARRLLVRILRALGRAGHLRAHRQTLEAFARDLARRRRLLPEVEAAFLAYQEVRFGGRPFDPARERVLLHAVDAATRMPPFEPAGGPDASDRRADPERS